MEPNKIPFGSESWGNCRVIPLIFKGNRYLFVKVNAILYAWMHSYVFQLNSYFHCNILNCWTDLLPYRVSKRYTSRTGKPIPFAFVCCRSNRTMCVISAWGIVLYIEFIVTMNDNEFYTTSLNMYYGKCCEPTFTFPCAYMGVMNYLI